MVKQIEEKGTGQYTIHINNNSIEILLSDILKGDETHNITYKVGLFRKQRYNNCRIIYCDVETQNIGFTEPSDNYTKTHSVNINNVVNIITNKNTNNQQGGKQKNNIVVKKTMKKHFKIRNQKKQRTKIRKQ